MTNEAILSHVQQVVGIYGQQAVKAGITEPIAFIQFCLERERACCEKILSNLDSKPVRAIRKALGVEVWLQVNRENGYREIMREVSA